MERKAVYFLIPAVLAMLVLGIVMLFSTSAFAQDSHGDPVYFVKRQLLWLGIGIIVCIGASLLDYHFWQRTWWFWLGLSVILLVLCFVPHIGARINGSHRWLNLVFFKFQPSEIGKLSAVVFLAYWFARIGDDSRRLLKGFAIPVAVIGVLLGLIVKESDLGTTALIAATMFVVMFVAGANLFYIGPLAALVPIALWLAAKQMKGRAGRLLAFWNPELYPADAYQTEQGLIAFGSGGVEGLGLGNGRQKFSYLPFAHTDFILPMVGEELGLRFTLIIVFCYLVITLCGTVIAIQARDRFGMLLAFGIVTLIALQAAVNIGVTTSLLPNKGLPLPFISYGGSNLVFSLLGIGILANIYRQGVAGGSAADTKMRLRARITPRI